MENEEFLNKDREQDVRTVLNKTFDSVQGKTDKKEWNEVMEESDARSRRVSRRTQLISVAAAAVVVIAITGAAIAVTSNGDNETIKTVDKKKNEAVSTSTSTTIPLSEEEKLLQSAYVLKVAQDSYPNRYLPQLYSAETGELVKDFTDESVEEFSNPRVSAGRLSVQYGSSGSECEDRETKFDTLDINLETLEYKKISGARILTSPNGTQTAQFSETCGPDPVGLTITNKNTKNTLEFNLVVKTIPANTNSYETDLISTKGITDVFWIDESRVLVNIHDQLTRVGGDEINGEYQPINEPGESSGWSILDLTNSDSLDDAKSANETFCCTWDDGMKIYDVISENGKTYVLGTFVYVNDDWLKDLAVIELSTGKIVNTKKIDVANYEGVNDLMFGTTSSQIYGATRNSISGVSTNQFGFAYDQTTDTTILKVDTLLIPRNR